MILRFSLLTFALVLFGSTSAYAEYQGIQPAIETASASPTPVMRPEGLATNSPSPISATVKETQAPTSERVATNESLGRTLYETVLSVAVLLFGFLIIALEVVVMLWLQKGWGAQSVRIVVITLIVTAALLLIVAGYSEKQIAPVIGLFGTIVGFVLGNTSKGKSGKATPVQQ
jgi:hypothetical protein